MKLPNGYGSVYKLSGNRRRPWVARKTVGYNDRRQPQYIFVGYYRTRADALQGLAEYNGYNIEGNPMETSLRSVYQAIEASLGEQYTIVWKFLAPLHDMSMRDLTLSKMQAVFTRSNRPHGTQVCMKGLLSKCFTYAARHELIRPEKAEIVRWIEVTEKKKKEIPRSVFTPEEISALWELYKTNEYASIPLILIHTGMRIDELLSMRSEDVTDVFSIRQAKTASGVRDVPIIEKIKPLVGFWKAKGTPYLITSRRGFPMSYQSLLNNYWSGLTNNHRTHDCRHTCATKLAEAGIDSRIVNAIIGHAGDSLAESVYTHISIEAKREALEKCF